MTIAIQCVASYKKYIFFIKKVKGMALLGKETNHDQTEIQQHFMGDKEHQ